MFIFIVLCYHVDMVNIMKVNRMRYIFLGTVFLLMFIFNACTFLDDDNDYSVVKVEKRDVVVNRQQFFSVKTPTGCSIKEQNKFVYDVLHDSYLWSDKLTNNEELISSYDSPRELLQSLKYDDDHFSHIMDLPKANSFFGEGKYNNFGFVPFLFEHEDNQWGLLIGFVYPGSPSENAGVKRGDIILKVDDTLIDKENIETIYNILQKKQRINITLSRKDKQYTKIMSKYRYTVRTVTSSHIFHEEGKKVGYMVLSDFIAMSKYEIDSVFRRLKNSNISEFILDLRYNGGGDVKIANHLASLIGGDNIANKVSEYTFFNQKYSNLNKTTTFESYNDNQLNLKRVFVITSNRTCSASERVIHNLKASHTGIEVIQIGKKTCGKPYAYDGVGVFCNKALFSINTESTNEDKLGRYVDGLNPTCEVDDDMFRPLGDKEESSLKEAISYINNGKCSTSNSSSGNKIIDFITEYLGL